jgi:DNA-binding beta-propeller fold protein YncE
MQPYRCIHAQTEHAAGYKNRFFPDGRYAILTFCLAGLMIFTLPFMAGAFNSSHTVIRSDSTPLKPDLEKGRFGSGKLYFDDPVDLAADEDDKVYILDAGNYRIQVMSDKGRYLGEWGSKGEEDGRFDEPVALAISPKSDFLVVLDRGTYRLHKFELDGTFLLSFGQEGSRKGMLKEPVDVTVDALDYIYILDRERDAVLKFHKSGAFIDEWGGKGRPVERLEDPVSIAYSDELTGYIYVLDAGKMALLKYQLDGSFKEVINLVPDIFEEGVKPLKIEASKENEVFILDGLNGKLIKIYDGQVVVLQVSSDQLTIDEPSGMAIDEENNVYISDLGKNRILRFQMELN